MMFEGNARIISWPLRDENKRALIREGDISAIIECDGYLTLLLPAGHTIDVRGSFDNYLETRGVAIFRISK